jgi:hypothetical protein
MSQSPARLGSGLVSVRKGEASPTTPADSLPEPAGPSPVLDLPRPVPPRESPGPLSQPEVATHLVRPPQKIVPRVSVSVRLPPDMQEWLRVEAFTRRMPIQNLIEEIVEFYQIHHRSGGGEGA